MTIVGARRATSYGREVARELGRELAAAGMVVVSGLAFGDRRLRPPRRDRRRPHDRRPRLRPRRRLPGRAPLALAADLREGPGRSPSSRPAPPPWRWTFPARNRIMAALAGMTVVVEAAARSGSLITADLAADLGRDLGAVPGPVTSPRLRRPQQPPRRRRLRGPRRPGRPRRDARRRARKPLDRGGPALDPALADVLAAVEAGESSCDGVAAALGLSGPEAAAALARLELLGYVACSTSASTRARCCRRRRDCRHLGCGDEPRDASQRCSRSPARTPAAAPGSRPT